MLLLLLWYCVKKLSKHCPHDWYWYCGSDTVARMTTQANQQTFGIMNKPSIARNRLHKYILEAWTYFRNNPRHPTLMCRNVKASKVDVKIVQIFILRLAIDQCMNFIQRKIRRHLWASSVWNPRQSVKSFTNRTLSQPGQHRAIEQSNRSLKSSNRSFKGFLWDHKSIER